MKKWHSWRRRKHVMAAAKKNMQYRSGSSAGVNEIGICAPRSSRGKNENISSSKHAGVRHGEK